MEDPKSETPKPSREQSLKEWGDTLWLMVRGFAEKEEQMQSFFIEDGEGKLSIVVAPWHNQEAKRAVQLFIALHLNLWNATRYCLTSEAWHSSADVCRDGGVEPSEAHDRQETLLACAVDKNGEIYFRSALIHQHADSPRRTLEDMESTTAFGGEMTKLFQMAEAVKDAPPELIEEMQQFLHKKGELAT